ncbi:MAG: hypothetical protein AB7Q29_14585 [Vicinamibacterales bacterium]
MSVWGEVFLGVIAAATLVTATVQIGVLVAAGRLARRVQRLTEHVDRELTPLFGHLNRIGEDAARAAGQATAQVERVDKLVGEAVQRLEQALDNVQSAVAAPAREGAAVLAGFRAVLHSIRTARARRPRHADDEDALFI